MVDGIPSTDKKKNAMKYVKKEYRHQGYSRILHEAILNEPRKRGFSTLYLKTDLENYYEKFGAIFIKKLKLLNNPNMLLEKIEEKHHIKQAIFDLDNCLITIISEKNITAEAVDNFVTELLNQNLEKDLAIENEKLNKEDSVLAKTHLDETVDFILRKVTDS